MASLIAVPSEEALRSFPETYICPRAFSPYSLGSIESTHLMRRWKTTTRS